jgi:zinc and cadmium transporter
LSAKDTAAQLAWLGVGLAIVIFVASHAHHH